MPRVKYIGKTHKKDSITGVGLEWEPGQVRDVSSTVAAHLLAYRDTWVRADREGEEQVDEVQDDEPIGLREEEAPREEPLEVVDFHRMTKDQMIEHAEEKHGVKLDRRKPAEELRHQLMDLHNAKADNR